MINTVCELSSASISAWVHVILRNCKIMIAQINKVLVHVQKK